MQIATVHICTVTVTCAYNILIIFSLSSLYLTLSSLSLRHTALSFSHLINLSSPNFCRSPLPPMRTRSSKSSHRTSSSPTTQTEFSNGSIARGFWYNFGWDLSSSSFRRSPPPPMKTRSSKPSRRTSPSPTTRMKFSDGSIA